MIVSLIHGTTPKIKGRLRDICIESKFTRFYRKSTERQQKGNRTSTKSLQKVLRNSTKSTKSLQKGTESLQKVYRKSTEKQQGIYRKSAIKPTEILQNITKLMSPGV